MDSIRRFVVAAVVCVGVMVLTSGCASTKIKRLSGDEFMRQAGEISQINSFHWTSFVGASVSRAYLEYGHPAFIGGGTRTTVYWVPLSDLPEGAVDKLTELRSPLEPRNSQKALKDRK